jgi:zona occludens toxin (predicted ATPase)
MDQAWVDMETFYPVRALQKTKHHEYRMENSDFRPVENAQAMPFRSELFLNNQSVLRVTTTDAQANTHVWDGLFNPENIDVPKSVRPASDRGGRSAGRR